MYLNIKVYNQEVFCKSNRKGRVIEISPAIVRVAWKGIQRACEGGVGNTKSDVEELQKIHSPFWCAVIFWKWTY